MNQKVIYDMFSYLKVHFGDLVITMGKKYSLMGTNI